VASDLDQALVIAKLHHDQIFIIGGQNLYEQAMPVAEHLIISHIHAYPEGDCFFPEIDKNKWVWSYKRPMHANFLADGSAPPAFTIIHYFRAKDSKIII
jgi:dihydrofolate reductase